MGKHRKPRDEGGPNWAGFLMWLAATVVRIVLDSWRHP